MKVGVAFGSLAHAYRLARYLNRRELLQRAYTYYPLRFIDPDVAGRCRSFPWLTAVPALSKIKLGWLANRLSAPMNSAFSRLVAGAMEPVDVFMAMSGMGLHARRAASAMGAVTVCDRGSTHIRYQDEILAEEHDLCKVGYKPIPPSYVAYEEAEYSETDLILAQSSFAYKSFIDRGISPSKLAWLSLGVDLGDFSPGQKHDTKFRVLYVGQISYRKGIQYLLEAAKSFVDADTELVLAGTILPEARDLLRRYEGYFVYAGSPRTKKDLAQVYRQASVFVFPSIEDGFGLVLNEAMACGLPVIASTNTGAPDLITEGREGFIVPIRSPEALTDRINHLRNHPAQAGEMAEQALNLARNQSWDAYGDRVVDLYRRTLASRGKQDIVGTAFHNPANGRGTT